MSIPVHFQACTVCKAAFGEPCRSAPQMRSRRERERRAAGKPPSAHTLKSVHNGRERWTAAQEDNARETMRQETLRQKAERRQEAGNALAYYNQHGILPSSIAELHITSRDIRVIRYANMEDY